MCGRKVYNLLGDEMDKKYLLDDKNTLKDHFIYDYSPRCQSFTEFDFEKDHCVNRENKDIDARFDYVSALNKEKVVAPVKINTECSFDFFGAPLIVIAQDICKKDGKWFYGKHLEVVAYEEGINVWEIVPDDINITNVELIGEKKFAVNEREKFVLDVEISKNKLVARIGADEIVVDYNFHKEFFVGFTACEGVNRFYSFNIKKDD